MNSTLTLDVAASLPGYVKVRLYYHTSEPQHVHSLVLKAEFSIDPPYVEHISILVPVESAYNRLSAYKDLFTALQVGEFLARQDKLKSFEFREEDVTTLSYYEVRT